MEKSSVKIPILYLTLRIERHSSTIDTFNEKLLEFPLHIIIAYAGPVKKVTPEISPPINRPCPIGNINNENIRQRFVNVIQRILEPVRVVAEKCPKRIAYILELSRELAERLICHNIIASIIKFIENVFGTSFKRQKRLGK